MCAGGSCRSVRNRFRKDYTVKTSVNCHRLKNSPPPFHLYICFWFHRVRLYGKITLISVDTQRREWLSIIYGGFVLSNLHGTWWILRFPVFYYVLVCVPCQLKILRIVSMASKPKIERQKSWAVWSFTKEIVWAHHVLFKINLKYGQVKSRILWGKGMNI